MAIVPFDFNGFELRTLGTIEDPLFVAADVCAVLDIGNVSAACDGLEDDEKLLSSMVASGQTRELLCLTESGLYSLVIRSRKPEARLFRKWLTSDVIPAIRKTGSFGASNNQAENSDFWEFVDDAIARGISPERIALERLKHQNRLELIALKSVQKASAESEPAQAQAQSQARAKVLSLSLVKWAKDRVIVHPTARTQVGTDKTPLSLFADYTQYCADNSLQALVMQIFSKSLVDLYADPEVYKSHDRSGAFISGLKLKAA